MPITLRYESPRSCRHQLRWLFSVSPTRSGSAQPTIRVSSGRQHCSSRTRIRLPDHGICPALDFAASDKNRSFWACQRHAAMMTSSAGEHASAGNPSSVLTTLADIATGSDILLVARDGWNWRFPYCGSDDTAVYHWVLRPQNTSGFEPPIHNLPLVKQRDNNRLHLPYEAHDL